MTSIQYSSTRMKKYLFFPSLDLIPYSYSDICDGDINVSSLVGMIDASTSPDRMRYYVSFSIIIFCCVVVIESFLSSLLPSSSAHSYFFLSILFCYFFLAMEYMCAGNEWDQQLVPCSCVVLFYIPLALSFSSLPSTRKYTHMCVVVVMPSDTARHASWVVR